jgi:hypothetical protein
VAAVSKVGLEITQAVGQCEHPSPTESGAMPTAAASGDGPSLGLPVVTRGLKVAVLMRGLVGSSSEGRSLSQTPPPQRPGARGSESGRNLAAHGAAAAASSTQRPPATAIARICGALAQGARWSRICPDTPTPDRARTNSGAFVWAHHRPETEFA